jgi:hypothetical protein
MMMRVDQSESNTSQCRFGQNSTYAGRHERHLSYVVDVVGGGAAPVITEKRKSFLSSFVCDAKLSTAPFCKPTCGKVSPGAVPAAGLLVILLDPVSS